MYTRKYVYLCQQQHMNRVNTIWYGANQHSHLCMSYKKMLLVTFMWMFIVQSWCTSVSVHLNIDLSCLTTLWRSWECVQAKVSDEFYSQIIWIKLARFILTDRGKLRFWVVNCSYMNKNVKVSICSIYILLFILF